MRTRLIVLGVSALLAPAIACDGDDGGGADGTGGQATGGSASGGTSTGGASTGGLASTGGSTSTGGQGGSPVSNFCDSLTLPALDTETLVSGVTRPVYVAQAPGDPSTFYVVEQIGRIQLVRSGSVVGTFLDISDAIGCTDADPGCVSGEGNERGLLGLAFHPGFADNGRFFVYHANIDPPYRNTIEEYVRSSDPDIAEPSPVGEPVLDVSDPAWNHNGGMLAFGPDGYLYAGMGDSGGGCDGSNNAQTTSSAFGKLHRFNVNAATSGAAAPGNPFISGGGLGTVWAYGFRNPWRFSFDRAAHDLYIGDVGQDNFEEISFQPASSDGGENYGWRPLEGFCTSANGPSGCNSSVSGCPTAEQHIEMGYVPPIFAAEHGDSEGTLSGPCAVVGGYVYRGSAIPALRGWYLFGDSCSNTRGALKMCDGQPTAVQRVDDLQGVASGLTSFGEDNAGELYLVSGGGTIVKIVAP